MSARRESLTLHDAEKAAPAYEPASLGDHLRGRQFSVTSDDVSTIHLWLETENPNANEIIR